MMNNYEVKKMRLFAVTVTLLILNLMAFCIFQYSKARVIKQQRNLVVQCTQPIIDQCPEEENLTAIAANVSLTPKRPSRDSFRLAWEEPKDTWVIKRHTPKVKKPKASVAKVKVEPIKVNKTEVASVNLKLEGVMEDVLGTVFGLSKRHPKSKYPYMYQYVKKYWRSAVNDHITYGIPASITLAQGILESNSGRGRIARLANNHFCIKYYGKHKIPKEVLPYFDGYITHHDDCCNKETRSQCKNTDKFVKYTSVEGSYLHHSLFVQRPHYMKYISSRYHKYNDWAWAFKHDKGGYATSKTYHKDLINLIKRLNLHKIDRFIDHNYKNPLIR